MAATPLNRERFLDLLARLVRHGQRLQNSPDAGLVPCEGLAADEVLADLSGPIERGLIQVQRLAGPGFESRPSLVLTIPGREAGSVGFVGAHFDVVPADREAQGWSSDPFSLEVGDDGTLRGRGVTDCLGHVALLTELLREVAAQATPPRRTVHAVLISNEEAVPVPGVGLDHVLAVGALEPLRSGPIFWLDATDFGPTVGTGGVARWDLRVTGVAGHSGMPQNCVNALELAMAASRALARWFVGTFPAHPEEFRYGFAAPSSLKATVIDAPNRGLTTIPGQVTVSGDIRVTPFYEVGDVLRGMCDFVAGLDRSLERDESPPGFPRTRAANGQRGTLQLDVSERFMEGLACDLGSPGLHALEAAMRAVRGEDGVQRLAVTFALPLVRDLQRRGFDVQITGFGATAALHAPDEFARLRDFEQGFRILLEVMDRI